MKPFGCPVRLLALLAVALPAILIADGGTVQFRRAAGPFVVTLFSSPSPLRTGRADLSVLIETANGNEPVFDAAVRLALRRGNRNIEMAPSHAQATNKLLYAASPQLTAPGTWEAVVTVDRAGSHAEAGGTIEVLPGPPAVFSLWPYFALVPLFIFLFLLNQRLKRRRWAKN
jgi:hypothetical protein